MILFRRVKLRKPELDVLAEIGALNSLEEGIDRRAALWQIEKSRHPKGPLWEDEATTGEVETGRVETGFSSRSIKSTDRHSCRSTPHPRPSVTEARRHGITGATAPTPRPLPR